MIVLFAGLPGTGKSTVATELARQMDGVVLNKDRVRAALFPAPFVEYSTEQDDFCIGVLLQAAGYLLARQPRLAVFIDGRVFSKNYQVVQVRDAVSLLVTTFRIIECVCSEDTARRRLERDVDAGEHPAKNRDFRLYLRLREAMEPIPEPKLVLDTDRRLEESVREAAAFLAVAR
ncbi:MAG: AAA family ATPase [Bryobacteraceae bacterium]